MQKNPIGKGEKGLIQTPVPVGGGDMIGTIVTENLASPGENLIRLLAIDDHAITPNAQVLEARIQFVIQESFLEVAVSLHGRDGCGCVGLAFGISQGVGTACSRLTASVSRCNVPCEP